MHRKGEEEKEEDVVGCGRGCSAEFCLDSI